MLRPSLQNLFLFTTLLLFIMKAHAAIPIRIITHNIRYAANPPTVGEKTWSVRKQLILNELHYNTLHNAESFICLQEVLHQQLLDIMAGLNKEKEEWAYIGVGRDDGKQAGEYSPIIYRKGAWELSKWESVWLNENGAVGKKGWDAGSIRIVTIGHFQHVQSKKKLVGLCTHFDNVGTVSRRESAKIILKVIGNLTSPTNSATAEGPPVFVAGDLNSKPSGEAYQILNASDSSLKDAQGLARWKYGNQYTFTDFNELGLSLIDFVFLGPKAGTTWSVEGYSVLANRFDDGVYNSDHRAVVVDGVLEV